MYGTAFVATAWLLSRYNRNFLDSPAAAGDD